MDVYTNILNWLKANCPDLPNLSRRMVKDGTVPAMYASEAEPKKVFGDYVDSFWEAFSQMSGGYWYLKVLPQLWRDDITEYRYTMPDGIEVYIPVTGTVTEEHHMEITGKTVTISTEVQGRKRKSKCFLANITHSFDAYMLRNIVAKCKDNGIDIMCIHDSFGVHPNHCGKIAQWYREELAALVLLDPLPKILHEIFGVKVTIPKFSNLTRQEIAEYILESEFALS